MAAAVEVDRISRSFTSRTGSTRALREVSFTIDRGEVVAVLGPNGAGKTTLTKILSTLLLPTSGQARILGHDVVRQPRAARAATSVVFGGDRGLYSRLTGRANLRFFAMLSGVGRRDLGPRVAEMLEQVGLAEVADRPVETYSKGMRQRLHIAIGLASRPSVLLLDEPTVGLDPIEARRLRDSVRELRGRGVAVLLTSHYLLDVEELADRVVLLDRGAVVSDLSLDEFAAEAGHVAVVEVRARGPMPRFEPLSGDVEVRRSEPGGADWLVTVRLRCWDAAAFRQVEALLRETEVVDVQVRPARLEEAYARLYEGVAP